LNFSSFQGTSVVTQDRQKKTLKVTRDLFTHINDLFFHVKQTILNAYAEMIYYHSDVDPLVLDRYISNDVEKAHPRYSQNSMIVDAKKHQTLVTGHTGHQFSFPMK